MKTLLDREMYGRNSETEAARLRNGFRFVAKDARRSESGKARYAYRRQSALTIRHMIISRAAPRQVILIATPLS